MGEPEPPRLYLKNVRISLAKGQIRNYVEGIGCHVGFIQNCRKDKEIQPRHQTVFIDMLNDSSLIIPFPFVFFQVSKC